MTSQDLLNEQNIPLQERLNNLYEFCVPKKELQQILETNFDQGLTQSEAESRLILFGPNQLSGDTSVFWLTILISQFFNAMTVVLLFALGLSAYHGDFVEVAVIAFVIVFNVVVGFTQEFKSEKTMEALMRMASPSAKVLRDTTVKHISARETVPGDVLIIEEGDSVPADARLYQCFHLQVDESLLTGESLPAQKTINDMTNQQLPVADRVNMVYSSTIVTKGRGKAIVTRTGDNTEIGKIAMELKNASSAQSGSSQKTPLQKGMQQLAIGCFILAIILSIIVFSVNNFVLNSGIISYAIGLSIAVVPEGILAVTTITMSYGVKKMATQKAIIRKLLALENIGSVSVICSDKTGTLTQGKMVLTKVFSPGSGKYTVNGVGYSPDGAIRKENEDGITYSRDNMDEAMMKLTLCSALCNMSIIKRVGKTDVEEQKRQLYPNQGSPVKQSKKLKNNQKEVNLELDEFSESIWEAVGDPTEAALQCFAWKAKLSKPSLVSEKTEAAPMSFELIEEYPFDSVLKRMSVIYSDDTQNDKKYYSFCKGSFESVLDLCESYLNKDGDIKPLNLDDKKSFLNQSEEYAKQGLRVLSLAFKSISGQQISELKDLQRSEVEKDLVFLGMVGLSDPPREESKEAIKTCHQAGITVHMLTGDHLSTACSIAQKVGILTKNFDRSLVMTGAQFDELTPEERRTMKLPLVIARCSPSTKVNMVDALQYNKQIVAMTGDGTNDAPSLKRANIGVAMGMNGSDVAKQASDIVLTDDNFASIVKAIAEGRRIFESVQKFTMHLTSTNWSEIILLVIGLAFRDQDGNSVFPMSAVQILVLNMLTGSPPSMGLGVQRASPDQMKVPPRDMTKKGSGVFSFELVLDTFIYGLFMGCFSLAVWVIALYTFFEPDTALGINSPLSYGCNEASNVDRCYYVFRARGATYALLSIMILIHAINCRHLTDSMFTSKSYSLKTLYINKVLCWSLFAGTLITIITLYIPGLNSNAFLSLPISWEWGPIIAFELLFVLCSEVYKYWKRNYAPKWLFARRMKMENSLNDVEVEKVEA